MSDATFTKRGIGNELRFLGWVVLAGLILRAVGLTSRSLWLDEYTSIEIATKTITDIINGTDFNRHTPPFYYIVLHFWFALAPVNELGLRLFSLLVDLLNIVALYLVFSSQFSKRIGALTSLFYAISPYAIYYAQEGRMYSLLLFLVILTYLIAVRFVQGHDTWRQSILLVIVGVLGMYTHYYYSLLLIGITVGVTLRLLMNISVAENLHAARKSLVKWYFMLVAICVCYLPWVSVLAQVIGGEGQVFRRFVFSVLPYTLFRFSAGYGVLPLTNHDKADIWATIAEHIAVLSIYGTVFFIAAICGIFFVVREERQETRLLLPTFFVPPLVALLISVYTPILSERYLIVIFPFFLCLLAFFPLSRLTLVPKGIIQLFMVVLFVFSLSQHYLNEDFGNTEWKEAGEFIKENKDCEKLVVVHPEYAKGIVQFYLISDYTIIPYNHEIKESILGRKNGFWLIEQATVEPIFEEQELTIVKYKVFTKENGLRVYCLKSRLL